LLSAAIAPLNEAASAFARLPFLNNIFLLRGPAEMC
jgi:hypothetical protein